MTTSIKMTPPQFEKLRKVIYDRTGILFTEQKQYLLESRLGRRLRSLEIDDYDQYYMLLTTGPFRDDEFEAMCDAVTINETSFFRNEPQLEYFENEILPGIIEARNSTKRLRIWSAACSTGEEPYTLGIILHRSLGIRIMDWKIEILATDLSEQVLDKAQAGVYGSFSFRSVPERITKKYFTEEQGGLKILPDVQQMVHFENHNLTNAQAARRFGTFDVIVCRNVMIYFDDDVRKNCYSMFHDQLADDGTFLIGHSEMVRDDRFAEYADPKSFAYRKASA